MNALTEWQGFYTLVGSAAGALIGLQFVLMGRLAYEGEGGPELAYRFERFGG